MGEMTDRAYAAKIAVDVIGMNRLPEDILTVAHWIVTGVTPDCCNVEADLDHPAVGDIVTEEPPVGSIVKRDGDNLSVWMRDAWGWTISHSDGEHSEWNYVSTITDSPLRLVRWGGGDE